MGRYGADLTFLRPFLTFRPSSHLRDYYSRSGAVDKTHVVIDGANHYYDGQRRHLIKAVETIVRWLNDRDLVAIALPDPRTAAASAAAAADAADAQLADAQAQYGGAPGADAMQISGVNHVALVTSDMERYGLLFLKKCLVFDSTLFLGPLLAHSTPVYHLLHTV